MRNFNQIWLVLCLFAVFSLARPGAQEEEPKRGIDKFLGLFDDERKSIIPNDNLLFGMPQYLDFSFGFDTGFNKVFWVGMGLELDYIAGPFHLTSDIVFKNDQKYTPAEAMIPSGSLGGFYFFLNEGGIIIDKKPLLFQIGRFRNYDELDSPYTLYINSNGISANTLKFRWESAHFIYQTQWISLNWNNSSSSPAWNEYNMRKQEERDWLAENSSGVPGVYNPYLDPASNTSTLNSYGFPDRGVNYKIFALKVNDWRLGFLDAAVYSGRPFDFEYLLSPIPMYFTQYFKATGGRPWATEENDNCLMGLFWDVKKSNWDAYAQVLVDDFSLGFLRFLYSGFSQNPWKAAWALGGRVQTPIGRFGFHHGGALKYTFEPIGTNGDGRYRDDAAATAYGYNYYPETRYYNGSKVINLLIEDTMVGYKYGENNLAFQADYQNKFWGFLFTSELELVLAGNNSPANPWHDYDARASMYKDGRYGSQLFNDGQIEKRLEFRLNISRNFGPLSVYTAIALGGRFNKLELKAPKEDPFISDYPYRTVDDEIWIWKATNKHELIFRFSIGFRYAIPVI